MSTNAVKRVARILSPGEVAAHRAYLDIARTMRSQIKKAANGGFEKGIAVKSRVMKELEPDLQRFAQYLENLTQGK